LAQKVTINVFGEEFTFETQASQAQASQVAEYVAQQVQLAEVGLGGASGPKKKIAVMVLAAMGIAHEYMDLKADHEAFLERMKARSKEILRRVDETVAAKKNK